MKALKYKNLSDKGKRFVKWLHAGPATAGGLVGASVDSNDSQEQSWGQIAGNVAAGVLVGAAGGHGIYRFQKKKVIEGIKNVRKHVNEGLEQDKVDIKKYFSDLPSHSTDKAINAIKATKDNLSSAVTGAHRAAKDFRVPYQNEFWLRNARNQARKHYGKKSDIKNLYEDAFKARGGTGFFWNPAGRMKQEGFDVKVYNPRRANREINEQINTKQGRGSYQDPFKGFNDFFNDFFNQGSRRKRSGGSSGGSWGGFAGATQGPSIDDALKTLNINKNIKTKKEAKTAYRKWMMKNHPDKGGSEEAAKKGTEAWGNLQKSKWFSKLAFFRDLF